MWTGALVLAAGLITVTADFHAEDNLVEELSDSPFIVKQVDGIALNPFDNSDDLTTRWKRDEDNGAGLEEAEEDDTPDIDSNVKTRWKREYGEEASVHNDIAGGGSALNLDSADSDQIQTKRFLSIFRNRPPKSEGYKRGPGFRSWGGKRANLQTGFETLKREIEYPLPFEQYEKRRQPFEGAKRRPFQSWGGKRSFNKNPLKFSVDDLKKLVNWEGKRKFSSWGGKRGDDDLGFDKRSNTNRKKPSFQSWGGKRSEQEDSN